MVTTRRRNIAPIRLKHGLVDNWPLANSSAVELRSALYSGSGPHDLVNNNSVTRAAGPSNNLPDAAAFASASSQYLSVTDASVALGGDSFEVVGWIFVTTTTGTRSAWADYLTTGNQRSWWLRFLDGSTTPILTLSTDGSASANLSFGSSIGTSAWTFIDFYFDANAQEAGIAVNNGAFITAAQTAVFKSTGNITIGARGGGADFIDGRATGLIARQGLFSAAERAWYFNDGDGRDLVRGV